MRTDRRWEMLDRNDPVEFADEHADVRHDPRRANLHRGAVDSIREVAPCGKEGG